MDCLDDPEPQVPPAVQFAHPVTLLPYHVMLGALLALGETTQAHDIWRRLRRIGLTPDHSTWALFAQAKAATAAATAATAARHTPTPTPTPTPQHPHTRTSPHSSSSTAAAVSVDAVRTGGPSIVTKTSSWAQSTTSVGPAADLDSVSVDSW